MDVRAQLDRFQNDHTGCVGVVLGDLSSGTVLCTASGGIRQQEWHDDLLAEAIDLLCLGLPDAEEGEWAAEAIVLTPEETRIFVLAEAPATEALCMVTEGQAHGIPDLCSRLDELCTAIGGST